MLAAPQHALTIWQAAVDAVKPEPLVRQALTDPALGIQAALARAPRILVFGGGKAGSAMSRGSSGRALADKLDRLEGDCSTFPLQACCSLKKDPPCTPHARTAATIPPLKGYRARKKSCGS